jgi:hypothetical protein
MDESKMNERIKQLAIEAKLIAAEPNGFDQTSLSPAQVKFAELIVKECTEHLESSVLVPNSEHSRVKWKCIRTIKEHFGVKE